MMTVGQFIRDVGTLSDVDLRSYLVLLDTEQDTTAHFGMATAALGELLKRERERCAKECDEMARKEHRLVADANPNACIERAWSHEYAAERIRELQ